MPDDMNAATDAFAQPWYREPWPWILMSGPAAVVVAGTLTAWIAFGSSDGVVADDYYKQGLAINQVKERDSRAAALGIGAQVQFNAERTRVRVVLRGEAQPAQLRLTLVHPTRSGEDQVVLLPLAGGGTYEGAISPPGRGKWSVRLEDGEGTWRLAGSWKPMQDGASLGGAPR